MRSEKVGNARCVHGARTSDAVRRLRRNLQVGDDTIRTLFAPASAPFFEAATMSTRFLRGKSPEVEKSSYGILQTTPTDGERPARAMRCPHGSVGRDLDVSAM